MKKIYPAYLIILVILATGIMSFNILKSNGSPGAKTGSPGDGGSCLECHSGTENDVANWLSSDIPESGYVPGTKYIITASGNHSGVEQFGFELTAEDASNAKSGTFSINDEGTKLVNGDAAVTHNANGTVPSGGSKTWTTEWTAPSAGTGDITFYAAFNAANGNGSTSGDVIYFSSMAIMEAAGSTGILNSTNGSTIHPYPNPVTTHMRLDIPSGLSGQLKVEIYNTDGKTVHHLLEDSSAGWITIDMSAFKSGTYFVRLKSSDHDYFGRVVKN